ncbi:hypothetical protein [Clostridium sp. KNHs216]|uniref:hypothetical protein n=1 Tax=Clostridium sp. KNHs216 TaxID=1550235 RepID=UPI0011748E78|nr:hypothetical protein LY85_0941 [Clostridium sp. KNHs216]TQI69022.1 hypothetical protein LY85_3771 [Clostridium sp. KNHs216]
MKIDWKRKLTSRKLWAAIVSFAALLVVALGGTEAQATQITALIMAGATVVAYIIGEGLVDAASAGAASITQLSAPIIGTVDPAPAEAAQTGADQAAEVKTDAALSGSEKTE